VTASAARDPVSDRAFDAVTFDFWHTICVPNPDRGRSRRLTDTRAVLSAEGFEPTDDELDAAILRLFEAFDAAWVANRQFTAADAVDVLAELVAPGLSVDARARLATRYQSPTEGIAPLTDNVGATLRALKQAGLAIGIVCDVGMVPSPELRGMLDHHGILDLFDHWSFSDEVGVYKPDPVIFEHALGGLGEADPARAVHIGDLRRTDVAGARAIGMTTVRYRGSYDDTQSGMEEADLAEADHVIDDHAELPAILGLA
jgi:FMN phosphatase YigB (HAD superfamily)